MATKTWRRGHGALVRVGTFAVASTLALAGCSGGGTTTTNPGAGSTSAGAAKVSGTLNILVSSATGSDAGFKAVSDAFKAKNPDVTVNLTPVPNENYNASKTSRLTAGDVDILVAQPKDLPSFVPASNMNDDARMAEAGGFADLTDQAFMKNFTPTVLDQIKFKGKNYAVPTGLSYYSGVMYNKKIFADNNLQVPKTWDDFVKVMAALKAKNITPLGIGGKDSAGLNMLGLVQSLYPTAADKTKLAQDLYGYSAKLNEGKQLEVMTKLATLYANAEPNFSGVNYATMTSDFAAGKYAMMADGTWNTETLLKAIGGKFDLGYFPLPGSNNADDNKFLGGKVELSLAVPANAKNKDAAIAWLAAFADPANYKTFLSSAGFAPAEQGVEAGAFYKEAAPYMSTFQPAWDTVWVVNQKAGPAAQRPFNWEGLSPMGTLDAKGAADAAQKDWEAGK